MSYPTNEEHFNLFKKEATKYLELFGLHDWRVSFKHTVSDDEINGECVYLIDSRYAEIRLAENIHSEPNDKNIAYIARHEVLELLLAPLRAMFYYEELLPSQKFSLGSREGHSIIRRIEHILDVLEDKQDEL